MINEFDFEIRYIKGKENRVEYALSRSKSLHTYELLWDKLTE